MPDQKIVDAVVASVNDYIVETRNKHRNGGKELPKELFDRYSAILPKYWDVLKAARIAFVPKLPNPDALNKKLKSLNVPAQLDFGANWVAMTYVDTILIASDHVKAKSLDDIIKNPLKDADTTLLHELVHIVQYAALKIDATKKDTITAFTKHQVPDYFHFLGLEQPQKTYEQITFEDGAKEVENSYKAKKTPLNGVEIAYKHMTAKKIAFTKR